MAVIIMSIIIGLYCLGSRQIFKTNLLSKVFNWFGLDSNINLNIPFSQGSRIFTYFPTVVLGGQVFIMHSYLQIVLNM